MSESKLEALINKMEIEEQEDEGAANAAPQFGRIKGAKWFSILQNQTVLVLGQGGIGSWVTLFLARAGVNTIYTFDADNFEEHNMTGQFVSEDYIGFNKANAIKEMVQKLSPSTTIKANPKMYERRHGSNSVVMCGFDNMKARKEAFMSWRYDFLKNRSEEDRKRCFFQDGRLLSEQLQIFNIPGDREDLMDLYEKEHLFDDSEVEEVLCTFKQTTHVAAIIAGQMVGFYTNFVTKAHNNEFRSVPFYYEQIIPLTRVTKN